MPRSTAPITRQRLIRTAMKLFHQQGYAATGLAQVLKKSEVRSGSLYYFYPSKEKLLEAVLDHYMELLHPAVLMPVVDRESDPIERLFVLLDLYRQNLVRTGCKAGCPIGNLALEVADHHAEARKKIAENFEAWRRAIRGWLEIAAPRLPRDVDCDRLATLVLTTMEGGVMLARAYSGLEQFDASVAMLRDYFNRLLVAGNSSNTQSEGGPT